jgi:membrane protein implicated in regulation of membrane protease activity
MMFLQGIAQLFCFPSLNTYCLDVMQNDGAEVIAGSYMIRYLFAAIGSATVLPAVERIGVGWFSTISAAFLALSSLATLAAILWGQSWRNRVEKKQGSKRKILEKEKGKTTTAIPAVVDSGEDKEIV